MIKRGIESVAYFGLRILRAIVGAIWAMLRPALRFIASVFMLVAIIALVADITRMQLSAPGPTFAPLAMHFREIIPGTLLAAEKAISSGAHPLVWNPLLTTLIAVPTWILFAVLSLLILYAIRERAKVNIFIN